MNAGVAFYLLLATVLGLAVLCVKPFGSYIADVMEGRAHFALRLGGRIENLLYRLSGVDVSKDAAPEAGTDPARPRYLITEAGIGYRLRPDERTDS